MESNHELKSSEWVDAQLRATTPANWQPDRGRALARLRQMRSEHSQRRQRVTRSVTVGAAVCAGVLAFPETRVIAERCVGTCATAGLRVWKNLGPPAKQVAAASAIAPDFTLADADGRRVRLSDFRGKVVLLNFWATWCGPCKTEIPWFVDFQRAYSDRGLVVLGVSLDEDGWAAVKPYLAAHPVNYRMMVGTDAVAASYGGIDALPVTLLIDREGRIRWTHSGLVSREECARLIEKMVAR